MITFGCTVLCCGCGVRMSNAPHLLSRSGDLERLRRGDEDLRLLRDESLCVYLLPLSGGERDRDLERDRRW